MALGLVLGLGLGLVLAPELALVPVPVLELVPALVRHTLAQASPTARLPALEQIKCLNDFSFSLLY